MGDGYEPHGLIYLRSGTRAAVLVPVGYREGCTRGVGRVGTGRVLYRVLPQTLQDPYLTYFQDPDPTYGQMKAFFKTFNEVSQIGSRIGLRLTQN